MTTPKHIVLLEPFFTGSHRQWAEGLAQHSSHNFEILSLPGRHWKWRMHGGAVTLAHEFLKADLKPDLILASDMLDLNTLLSLTRNYTSDIPVGVYFHENQITYPWSPGDPDPKLKRDNHYGFINFTTALAADCILFNSAYHRESFLEALPGFLSQFPDHQGLEYIDTISKKASLLPLGLDLGRFDRVPSEGKPDGLPPIILWNHRWEYDKNPQEFFEVLFKLKAEGQAFRLVVLGESYGKVPEIFAEAQKKLSEQIIHWGYANDFTSYAQWLKRSDILPVTSFQDFFGGSVVEAIYCGCYPLLPERLAYREHIPLDSQEACFYKNTDELLEKLRERVLDSGKRADSQLSDFVSKYDWQNIIGEYDRTLVEIEIFL